MSDPSQNNTLSKKRGAPLGNLNAVKHGFYSHQLQSVEVEELQAIEAFSLTEEVELMRVNIRRLMEFSKTTSSFSESIELVRALTLASTCITRLMRTHDQLRHIRAAAKAGQKTMSSVITARLAELEKTLDKINN